jgi:hypothetical protein
MYYELKNCFVAREVEFVKRGGNKPIILEPMVDGGLHIWHGLSRSNNNLNILNQSPLLYDMLTSEACDMYFVVNNYENDQYYLLTDYIYP